MIDELIRAVVAVPVAVLLPVAWRKQPGRAGRAVLSGALAAVALAPPASRPSARRGSPSTTLLSLMIAAVTGFAVRAATGLDPVG